MAISCLLCFTHCAPKLWFIAQAGKAKFQSQCPLIRTCRSVQRDERSQAGPRRNFAMEIITLNLAQDPVQTPLQAGAALQMKGKGFPLSLQSHTRASFRAGTTLSTVFVLIST